MLDLKMPEYKLNYEVLGITAFDIGSTGNLVVGTKSSTILEITKKDFKTVNQGHYKHPKMSTYAEVWGCAVNPLNEEEFITSGGDKRLRKF